MLFFGVSLNLRRQQHTLEETTEFHGKFWEIAEIALAKRIKHGLAWLHDIHVLLRNLFGRVDGNNVMARLIVGVGLQHHLSHELC